MNASSAPSRFQPPRRSRPSRRAAIVPVLGALACVLLLAAILQWQLAQQKSTNPQPQRDTMTWRPDHAGEGAAQFDGSDPLLTHRSSRQLMLAHPDDEPMDSEPAGIDPYPGAVRQSGFIRRASGIVEEVSFWELALQPTEPVWDHYLSAAASAGFTLLSQPQSTPWRSSRLLVRGEDGVDRRVLTVRVRPNEERIRIMLWLRYHEPTRKQPFP